ncbi:hypothetical protein E5S70_30215 [Ensifer adhaerens]|uniref:Pnap_2097 family protein n=1 Tax=Ensifer canadensis TaxID=555315 RepID=UPI0014902CCA|nr:Pnap_2097 family protein [Ensifer canadensis]NOV20282.1 hypothetical protein [Ensifer canadensis]
MPHSTLYSVAISENTLPLPLWENADDDGVSWLCKESETYLLGMPQLCLKGLSESWLLKELGHRHWMMLARLAGLKAPSFADEHGTPVYAAFCALSIREAGFGEARENENLLITTKLRRVSRTQMLSYHQLYLSGYAVGSVEMISTFVRRTVEGGNHTVSRYGVPGFPPVSDKSSTLGLASCAAAVRSGRADNHMGFAIDEHPAHTSMRFDPCPAQDFNGAGFLYFSSFVSFVDRAEWQFAREHSLTATTSRRDVFFSGNIDPGETLVVKLMGLREDAGCLAHHCQMVREQDGMTLARIFTIRQLPKASQQTRMQATP